MDGDNVCDWCGDECDGHSDANALACTYGQCPGGIYHQDCLYQFLRANKLEKNRKTGFKCPRGCGKGTRSGGPCPGRIDKSHPYIPRNEEKFKKRQLATVFEQQVLKPTKVDKQEKVVAKPKAEDTQCHASVKTAKVNAAAAATANIKILNQIGKTKDRDSQFITPAAISVLNRQAGGASVAVATGNREKPAPAPAVAAPSAWATRPGAAAAAIAAPPPAPPAQAPDSSGDSDLNAAPSTNQYDFGVLPIKETKKKKKQAMQQTTAAAPAAASAQNGSESCATTPPLSRAASAQLFTATGAVPSVCYSQTNNGTNGLADATEICTQDPFPPMTASASRPVTVSAWVPLPGTALPPRSHAAAPSLSTAGSLASNGPLSDLAGQDADDEDENLSVTGAKGVGLSKAQRKNVKRQEKKKRQASLTHLDAEGGSHVDTDALLHEALAGADLPRGGGGGGGTASTGAHTPRTTQSGGVTESSSSVATAPVGAHLAANAAHLLDDTTTQSSPSQAPDDDPLHLLLHHEAQNPQHIPSLFAAKQPFNMPPPASCEQTQRFINTNHASETSEALTLDSWMRGELRSFSKGSAGGFCDGCAAFQQRPPLAVGSLSDRGGACGFLDPQLEERCVRALASRKCQRLYSQLLQLSFFPWQAAGAVQACGVAAERAVQWLLDRIRCNPHQLSAAAAATATPDVDVSAELSELLNAQAWLGVRTDILYQTVIDVAGDVHAALLLLSQHTQTDTGRQTPPMRQDSTPCMQALYPAHAHSDLPSSISRAHTVGGEEAPWMFGATAASTTKWAAATAATPFGDPRHAVGSSARWWSMDMPPFTTTSLDTGVSSAAHVVEDPFAHNSQSSAFLGGGQSLPSCGVWPGNNSVQDNGNGNGNNSAHLPGLHCSMGVGWESHGSSSTVEQRAAHGQLNHAAVDAGDAEVQSLLALMCS